MKALVIGIAITVVLVLAVVMGRSRLFSRSVADNLGRLASLPGQDDAFIAELWRQGVWVVLETVPEGPDGLVLLEPEDASGRFLALFSTQKRAETFVMSGALSKYPWRTSKHTDRGLLSLPISAPNLRFWAEARLPELYEAIGNSEKANKYMSLARQHSNGTLQHMQHSATTNLMTPDEIREFVTTFDAKRLPKWREKESPTKKSTVL